MLVQHTNDFEYDCTCGGKPVYVASEWKWRCPKCGSNNWEDDVIAQQWRTNSVSSSSSTSKTNAPTNISIGEIGHMHEHIENMEFEVFLILWTIASILVGLAVGWLIWG